MALLAALWLIPLGYLYLPGDPTPAGAPWGAFAFYAALMFGLWIRARAAYWLALVGEVLGLLSGVLFATLLGLPTAAVLVLAGSARLALLLSRPVSR